MLNKAIIGKKVGMTQIFNADLLHLHHPSTDDNIHPSDTSYHPIFLKYSIW